MIKKITSKDNVHFKEETLEFTDANVEYQLVNIYPQKVYQTMNGFGGAFTESGGYALSKLDSAKRKQAIDEYFGENGLNYTYCRTHIHSCDFALGNYTYVDENDFELESFNLKRDYEYLIPFIKDAQATCSDKIKVLASPWSPPAFMKTTNKMNEGGKLKPECRELWAKYLVKYILAYKNIGIDIYCMTVQNEPHATQSWDSCVYNTEEEYDFAVNYLVPAFKSAGIDTHILLWDHNKERVYDKAKAYLNNDDIWGIAFHWYTGDHFEALQMVSEDYPNKQLIFSEGCLEYSRYSNDDELGGAEIYAYDMIGDLNSGMTAFMEWNMFLDERGGPNHVDNFCAAPIMCKTNENEYHKMQSYYYIGHFSKYIKPGAKRIGFSKFTHELAVTAFSNPDGSVVVVVLNRSDNDIDFYLRDGDKICETSSQAHSISTYIY